MMLLAGTVPVDGLPLTRGPVSREGQWLVIDGQRVVCTQGTAAMISAALAVTEYLHMGPPQALIVGDTGSGKGSREMYEYLVAQASQLSVDTLTLHYCLPDMGQTKRLCAALEKSKRRPVMIADAASMYAAKAAGLANAFDIFTPDASEMSFLADAEATHPAYIARHLFDADISRTPELVEAASRQKSTAKLMVVKGATDYIVSRSKIVAEVCEPDVPALEAIGGTGDTITGMLSALVTGGMAPVEAAVLAARANREAGRLSCVTPATRVWQMIEVFPQVLGRLSPNKSDCSGDFLKEDK